MILTIRYLLMGVQEEVGELAEPRPPLVKSPVICDVINGPTFIVCLLGF